MGTRLALFRESRRAFNTVHITGITLTAAAAFSCQVLLTIFGQIRQPGAGLVVLHQGAYRYLDENIRALGAGAVLRAAAVAVLGNKLTLVAKIYQRVQIRGSLQDDAATLAAVAAVGAAFFHKLFPAETAHAVAALTSFHINPGFICKNHDVFLIRRGQ